MDSDSESVHHRNERLKQIIDKWLIYALMAGLAVTVIFGASAGIKASSCRWWISNSCGSAPIYGHVLGALVAPCIAAGAVALGVMAGFIFGLPRSLTSGEVREIGRINSANNEEQNPPTAAGQSVNQVQTSRSGSVAYGANTNLERISDWLTTIIVGVGLTNLSSLPKYVDNFGQHIDLIFMFGGKAFGIGGGLFFLIFGFLLSYISTRTKLMLVFTANDKEGRDLVNPPADPDRQRAVNMAIVQSVLPPESPTQSMDGQRPRPKTEPSETDLVVLNSSSLQDKQTPEDLLALANASARSGDYSKAKVLYDDYLKTVPSPGPDVYLNYASVLGLNGDRDSFAALSNKISEPEKVSLKNSAEANFVSGMRSALQANLYNERYEDSIRIGEMLIERKDQVSDAWVHIWLACAYGQKHEILRRGAPDPAVLDRAAQRAAEEVGKALILDPTQKSYIASLYDPKLFVKPDDDLLSLYGDPRMEALFAPSEPATDEAPPVALDPPAAADDQAEAPTPGDAAADPPPE